MNVIQIISCAIDYDNKKTIARGFHFSLYLSTHRFVVDRFYSDLLRFVYALWLGCGSNRFHWHCIAQRAASVDSFLRLLVAAVSFFFFIFFFRSFRVNHFPGGTETTVWQIALARITYTRTHTHIVKCVLTITVARNNRQQSTNNINHSCTNSMEIVRIGNTNCRIVIRKRNKVVSCYSCVPTGATDHSGDV